MRDIIN